MSFHLKYEAFWLIILTLNWIFFFTLLSILYRFLQLWSFCTCLIWVCMYFPDFKFARRHRTTIFQSFYNPTICNWTFLLLSVLLENIAPTDKSTVLMLIPSLHEDRFVKLLHRSTCFTQTAHSLTPTILGHSLPPEERRMIRELSGEFIRPDFTIYTELSRSSSL